MSKLKKINLYAIVYDLINCFIFSCGLMLLLCFFFYETITPTKEAITQSVGIIFLLSIFILVIREILTGGSHWCCNITENKVVIKDETTEEVFDYKHKDIAEYNRKISAIHESGHAVMAYLKNLKSFEVRMSHVSPCVITVFKNADAEDLHNIILIKYSGAIAEELLLGKFHLGCMESENSDFRNVTELIKSYIVMTDHSVSKTLLNEELSLKAIELSKQFYQEGKNILSNNKQLIEILSEELMGKDFMSKENIVELLRSSQKTK